MEQTGLAGIAKYVMRERQHLGCLRVREGVITLVKMYFHDEIRPLDDIAPRKSKAAKAELDMATALIEQFTSSFDPKKYEDTYREALLAIIKAKQKGKTIEPAPVEEEEEPTDLLAALKASVEAAKSRSKSSGGRKAPAGSAAVRPASRPRARRPPGADPARPRPPHSPASSSSFVTVFQFRAVDVTPSRSSRMSLRSDERCWPPGCHE